MRAFLASLILACLTACGPGGAASAGADEGGSETGGTGDETGGDPECLLALRIDLCCNQPFAATPVEVEAEPCVVPWPVDWEALPADLVDACAMAQPEVCGIVDCGYAEPASEMVGLNEDGECAYLCPEDLHLGYSTPGCEVPPPIVECLPTPLPCADEYCSCEGETIWGCGQTGEPFEHMGACE